MHFVLIIALAVALVACVIALAREIRVRKALEHLLSLIFCRWRTNVSKPQDSDFGDGPNTTG
jgi:hypothetical protein